MRRFALSVLVLLAFLGAEATTLHKKAAGMTIYTFDPPELIGLNGDPWVTDTILPASDYVEIGSNYGSYSAPNALSLLGAGPAHGGAETLVYRQVAGTIAGRTYQVSVWLNADLAEDATPLVVGVINVGSSPQTRMNVSIAKLDLGILPGWHRVVIGSFVSDVGVDPDVLLFNLKPTGHIYADGRWVIDDIEVVEDEDMTKRREIREALFARIGTVSTANGYTVDLGEVVMGPTRIPDGVGAWPHVSLRHGEEAKTISTLGRKSSVLTFYAGVACKRTDTADPDDQADDACGEIEKAVELFANGAWLGLGYVQNVFVVGIDPEELTPEVARDMAAWVMTIEVTYVHNRRQP